MFWPGKGKGERKKGLTGLLVIGQIPLRSGYTAFQTLI